MNPFMPPHALLRSHDRGYVILAWLIGIGRGSGHLARYQVHQENLKILFYTFLHFFVKKLKKYEKDKSFTCQTTF